MARHLLSLQDISREDFASLLRRFAAWSFEGKSGIELKGKMVGLLFDRPSTRTRLSFHKAVWTLGGSPVPLQTRELQLVTGESPIDVARILPLYLDALIVRTHSVKELEVYASQNQMAIINALTDEEHPTQALADLLTIQNALGTLDDVRILFIGEGGNIAISFLFACAMLSGIAVTFLTPSKYSLPEGILDEADRIGVNVKERISESHDPRVLPSNIDIVYTTRWRSMGEEKHEQDWRRHFQGFQVTRELLQAVGRSRPASLMHDLPAERGAEVTAELLDDEQNLVIRQAKYKVNAAQAALCWCLELNHEKES